MEDSSTTTILIGDFNLNYEKIFDDNYCHKNLFNGFKEELSKFIWQGLARLVNLQHYIIM